MDSDFMSVSSSGRLNILAIASMSSHFLVDTSRYAVHEFDGRITLSVGDHVFSKPIFFHIGSSMASAYRNETSDRKAMLRFEDPLSHVIVAQVSSGYILQIQIDNVGFEMINCTFIIGNTDELNAAALNPPEGLSLRGSVMVEGARGRLILGAATVERRNRLASLLLYTTDSFIVVRDGATIGNMVRDDFGEHIVPCALDRNPSYALVRSVPSAIPALLLESGAEMIFHGHEGVRVEVNGAGTHFWMDLVDSSVHIYANLSMLINSIDVSGGDRHTLVRSTLFIHEYSELMMVRSWANLIDVRVIGDGANGANYGVFGALSVFEVYDSLVIRGVRTVSVHDDHSSGYSSFRLNANATVEFFDYVHFEKFDFTSFAGFDGALHVYETGTAPSVFFRSTDDSVSHVLSTQGFSYMNNAMYVYIESTVQVSSWIDIFDSVLYVSDGGWIHMDGSGSLNTWFDSLEFIAVKSRGLVSGPAFGVGQGVGLPWLVLDGGIIESVSIYGSYGRCVNGTVRNVEINGVADILGGSLSLPMSVSGGRCGALQGAFWQSYSDMFSTLFTDYTEWSSVCRQNYPGFCCIRVSNVPQGIDFFSIQEGVVIGSGVSTHSLTITDHDELFELDIRAPPSDSTFWIIDEVLPSVSIDYNLRVVATVSKQATSNTFTSLPKRRGDANFTTDSVLPMLDVFGSHYGSMALEGCHARLHGFFGSKSDDTVQHGEPSILEFSGDVEAPLHSMSLLRDVRLVARRGALLSMKEVSAMTSVFDDPGREHIDMIVEESLVDVSSSTSLTVEWHHFDIQLRGGHLRIGHIMSSSGEWVVESGSVVTVGADVSERSFLDHTFIRVRAGGRLIFAAGRLFDGDLMLEAGSVLVLPGAGGVSVIGDVKLESGASIVQLYGDGDRVSDGSDEVADARLFATGTVTVGAGVSVVRTHVDVSLPPLTPALSLVVLGGGAMACNESAGDGWVCDSGGLAFVAEVTTSACAISPTQVSRPNCVQCVSNMATSCVYAIHEADDGTYSGVCMGGSSVDGALAHVHAVANATLYEWSATTADCYVISQPRCHGRTQASKCAANGGAVAPFEHDATLDEHARCRWCSADLLNGVPRCLTQFEMEDGLCADEPVVTETTVSLTETTVDSAASSGTTETGTAATTVAPTPTSTTTISELDLMVTEPQSDAWVWGVIGGLGTLFVLVAVTALLCVFTPLGRRRRRKRKRDDSATQGDTIMANLSVSGGASSLPTISEEYSPMPVLTGTGSDAYAEGELEPRVAGLASADGEYASGEMVAPHLQLASGDYASGDMAAPHAPPSSSDEYATGDMAKPRLARTGSEYNAASEMFHTTKSDSSGYAKGDLGADVSYMLTKSDSSGLGTDVDTLLSAVPLTMPDDVGDEMYGRVAELSGMPDVAGLAVVCELYRPDWNRKEATKFLGEAPDGAAILRRAAQPNRVNVSYKVSKDGGKSKIQHSVIFWTPKGYTFTKPPQQPETLHPTLIDCMRSWSMLPGGTPMLTATALKEYEDKLNRQKWQEQREAEAAASPPVYAELPNEITLPSATTVVKE